MADSNMIVCPHCHEQFMITPSAYNQILQQVRTQEFQSEIDAHIKQSERHIRQVCESEMRERLIDMQRRLDAADMQTQLAVNRSVSEEREKFHQQIAQLQAEVNFHKNMKLQMSTKMVGETLEQHCQTEFDRIRALAFPTAYFEKDNDARTGSKGDYIFRQLDADTGEEILSIMFEMKNEMDGTAVKHKNEDFFKKLDSDRTKKSCKYAVLVSMLEQDSDYYNQGIVDVSHKYTNMYVIRPQFFIPFLTLLYKNAVSAFTYRQQCVRMEQMMQQSCDDEKSELIAKQDADLNVLRHEIERYSNHVQNHARLIDTSIYAAVKNIDMTIQKLQKTRELLIKAGDDTGSILAAICNLESAGDKE